MLKIKTIGPDGMIYLPRGVLDACGWSEQEVITVETDGDCVILRRWDPQEGAS